jgi:hypothetical protein
MFSEHLTKSKLKLFIAFALLLVLSAIPSAAYAAKVRFYYDIGRFSRQNVFGMGALTGNNGVSLATSPFSYDLRIYDDEKYIGKSYTDIDDLDIDSSNIPHLTEYISSPALVGQVVKYIDFECDPGVKYFDLWYKTDAQDNFAHSGSGVFTVVQTADPNEIQEFFLSCVLVSATVVPNSATPGHVIEVRDYLQRLLTPSYVLYPNNDPGQGDSRHYYPAVMTGPDKPYYIRISPLDERYSFFETEYSFNTSYMTSTQFWRTFTVTNAYNVDLNTAVTLKVTAGAGLRVFTEKKAHFLPFVEATLAKTGTAGGYDVYETRLPMAFWYNAGGEGSGFLKQIQGVRMIKALESIEITIDAEPLDPGKRAPADPNVSDGMYFNVNDAQHVVLREE